jgi:hypothetical protein
LIPKAKGKASNPDDRDPRLIMGSTSDVCLSRGIWGKPINQKNKGRNCNEKDADYHRHGFVGAGW